MTGPTAHPPTPEARPAPTAPAAPLAALARATGPGALLTDPADRARLATDRSGHRPDGLPLAVVRAGTVDDVVATLRWATAHRVPVVPRGAGTGLAGGATAGAGTVVLDLGGLDRVLAIRPEDGLAEVEPGVLTAELDRAARALGLRYAPDPASAESATIGGNIATNAGGLHCVKYGVTRDAVLGLDVVLADGSRLRTGRRTVKGVAGYDLTSLLTGSEGTLAVVVGATLRLHPLPPRTGTAAAYFASPEAAAAACAAVLDAGLRPSVLEFLDAATLAAIDRAGGAVAAGGQSFVLAQTDGFAAEAEIEAVAAVLRRTATRVEATAEPATAERLLATRRAALPAIERLGRVLIEDIAVPRSRLAEAARGLTALADRTGVPVFTFAHAGDGNIHPIVLAGGQDPAAVRETVDGIFRLALGLAGTITGEHGVGVLKRPWLEAELSAEGVALQRRLKAALDPLGILNPGKAV
ncbi:FAD-linked oxidase C-terminal domain-containing protein [Streptomyces sp. DSM 44915]|uniref:FAD-linked oxidase C-terminal domain-containing protein n=1 Tax=Streptomyces chisholmiae TaxID=3075540 RepID=A0ABU2JNR8_9ACTN|nr:FAD-linked oxidase C-terminal domain-containing protein [Streptomyces sp. DSM 44915]MDT0266637.1 FAD-linked oxidase C-terminal domain-containing protein [Streptomyces sp. DSM 44915]